MTNQSNTELSPISQQIWDLKYRLKTPEGTPLDAAVEDTWTRVAKAIAEAEAPDQRDHWQARFFDILEGFDFLPAGRILAGAGAERSVTLFN